MSDDTLTCTIKLFRRRKGLSQDELAHLVGIRRQAVYDMESGRYLPNTAVALRLARVLGCTVEMLFMDAPTAGVVADYGGEMPLLVSARARPRVSHVPSGGTPDVVTRVALAQVRGATVAIPLQGQDNMPFSLRASNGLLRHGNQLDLHISRAELESTVVIRGCDPALMILHEILGRVAPRVHAHTLFASSRQALQSLADGAAHMAGTHFHNAGSAEANLEAVRSVVTGTECLVVAFSVQEEGLMVAAGNPLGIRDVQDLAGGKARFVNREQGAALRRLLDSRLAQQGIPATLVEGYDAEVGSHCEGAYHVVCKIADAALGLRVVAESFGLSFVPLTATRCDVVIPADLTSHEGVAIVLNVLQSARLQQELRTLPGYDASLTGKIIAG